MTELSFECLGVDAQRHAAMPTLQFRLAITEAAGATVHAIALRCQIRIETARRQYSDEEAELLRGHFGDRSRWSETLKPLHFANTQLMVPTFTGHTEMELPVPCSYDTEVAAGGYFHALAGGVVPLTLMFSGTVFGKGDRGFWVDQVPWDTEAECPMPVTVWQRMMDQNFPQQGWIRLHRDSIDALMRYKAEHAIGGWDAVVEKLLGNADGGTV